jgi:hypothetical protein
MAKTYKLTESQIPERRSQSLYADIVNEFIAQGAESMQVTIEGLKPATLRAGLRRALKGHGGVKMAQMGVGTYLVRQVKEYQPSPPRVSLVWHRQRGPGTRRVRATALQQARPGLRRQPEEDSAHR